MNFCNKTINKYIIYLCICLSNRYIEVIEHLFLEYLPVEPKHELNSHLPTQEKNNFRLDSMQHQLLNIGKLDLYCPFYLKKIRNILKYRLKNRQSISPVVSVMEPEIVSK